MNPSARVIDCYSVLDAFMPACGFEDLTDGLYEGGPSRPYEQAQACQAEVLLDRAGCGPGSRLLDIGCGYGRILRAARARGARPRGITISPEQAKVGKRTNLDVALLDFWRLDSGRDGPFDCVIANGSLEHFVQPADALAEQDDEIYRQVFSKVHRLLDPCSASERFVTTIIHFRSRPEPADLMKPASAFPRGSSSFHWARLAAAFGGWYPLAGQLERCAQGYFDLIHEEDGTEDYRLTSEAWLQGVRKRLRSLRGVWVGLRSLPAFLRRPVHTVRMFLCMLGSESWNWQFRGDSPPARLLRQTWQRLDR